MHLVTRFCAHLTGTRSPVRRRDRRDSWAALTIAAVIGGSLLGRPPAPPGCSGAEHREHDAIAPEPFGPVVRRWQHTVQLHSAARHGRPVPHRRPRQRRR